MVRNNRNTNPYQTPLTEDKQSRRQPHFLNNNGITSVYLIVIMLVILIALVSASQLKVNLTSINNLTLKDSEENNFVNNLENKITNTTLINLYEPTTLKSGYNGNEYTAEIYPSTKLTKRPVTEAFKFNWNGTSNKVTRIDFTSNQNKQMKAYVSNKKTLTSDELLVNSKQFIDSNVNNYNLSGNTLTLDIADAKVKKVVYRFGEGEVKQVNGYPTTKTISLTGVADTTIITVEYLDKHGKQIKMHRFSKKEPTNSKVHDLTSWDTTTLIRLPNTNRIIGKRELTQIITKDNVKETTGEDLKKSFSAYNTVRVSTQVDNPTCFYWKQYSKLSSKYIPISQVNKMSLNGSCPMEGIDGFDTITPSSMQSTGPYCSDTAFKDERKQAMNDYEALLVSIYNSYVSSHNSAVSSYNTAFSNWNHVTNPGGQPTFSAPSPPSYPSKPPAKPCIAGERDAELVEYQTGEKLISQLTLSFVNNVTANYEIEVEYEAIIPRYPVTFRTHYVEGSDTYKIEDSVDKYPIGKKTMKLSRTILKNFDYNDIDLTGTYDVARNGITPREFSFAIENAKITNVKITTEEFKESLFKYKIKDSNGKTLRNKKMKVNG